jgi:uncharacterized protein (DUF1684 family)
MTMKKLIISLLFLSTLPLVAQNTDSIIAEINNYHQTLNKEYADAATSPLDSADLLYFSSLSIFPPNLDFYTQAHFTRTKKEKKFKMKTSTDRLPVYKKYGELSFEIKGTPFKLNVYQNVELAKKKAYKYYLFLPFTDVTNGETTYGGGRYIDLTINEKELKKNGYQLTLDFNKAYNPYCAYTHRYSCPIPPAENFMNIRVEAGVREGLIYK